LTRKPILLPTRGNLFLPVCLLVWADGAGKSPAGKRGARAELQGAPKQKLLQLKNSQKYHWVKHSEMLICCFDVSLDRSCPTTYVSRSPTQAERARSRAGTMLDKCLTNLLKGNFICISVVCLKENVTNIFLIILL
jgi:hypothetical protein